MCHPELVEGQPRIMPQRSFLGSLIAIALCFLPVAALAEQSVPAMIVWHDAGVQRPRMGHTVLDFTSGSDIGQRSSVSGNLLAIALDQTVALYHLSPLRRIWIVGVVADSVGVNEHGVYITTLGKLLRLSLADGQVLAKRSTGKDSRVSAVDRDRIYVTVTPQHGLPLPAGTNGDSLAAFDDVQLHLQWKHFVSMTASSPATLLPDNAIVQSSSGSGAITTTDFDGFNRRTGGSHWRAGGVAPAISGFARHSIFIQDHWVGLDNYAPLTITEFDLQTGKKRNEASYAPDAAVNFSPGQNAPFGDAAISGNLLVFKVAHHTYLYRLGASPDSQHPLDITPLGKFAGVAGSRFYFENRGKLWSAAVIWPTVTMTAVPLAKDAAFAGASVLRGSGMLYVVDPIRGVEYLRVPDPCRIWYTADVKASASALVLRCEEHIRVWK